MAKTEKKPVSTFYLEDEDFPEELAQAYEKYNEIREGIGKALKALGTAHAAMERALDPYLKGRPELVEGGSWKASYTNDEKDTKAPEGFASGLKIEVFEEAYGSRHWRNLQKKGKATKAKLVRLFGGAQASPS